MQTSKVRNGSSDAPQRASPITPKSTRATRSGESRADSDSPASKLTPTKAPTDRGPKVTERRSPRSPATEKKRPSKLTELEAQLTQLQEDLKKTKDQLSSSESSKKRAEQEAEDLKHQLQSMASKLEESKNQLVDFSSAEESRLQELRKISQDRDRVWQSELEAIQTQHAMDSAALSSSMSEIHKLKLQLDMAAEAEEHREKELAELKEAMIQELSKVEELKMKIVDSERAEAEAEAKFVETQQQLEVAKATVETLRDEGAKLLELFRASISELEESKGRVSSLEGFVQKLQDGGANESLVLEVEKLKSALEAAEIKYKEEQSQVGSEIWSAYEMAEKARNESRVRESELESTLRNAKAELDELKASLHDKETEVQSISNMNEELKAKLDNGQVNQMKESAEDFAELKANLMDKENELQSICEENELLKQELAKKEVEIGTSYESAIAEMELAKAKEKEALLKLEYITEEAEKRVQEVEKVSEQLETAKTMNSEMEVELRRLRVQSDQWRKAAEAAAAVLTTGNNGGRFVQRTGSMDNDYQSVAGKLLNSPFSDDMEDESPKKKNNNVLRKFGGLWKKNSK